MAELSNMAMLSNLHVSMYAARKFDKKATAEVASWHQTSEKVGRYSKRLLPDDAESYKVIATAATHARQVFYKNTLPWLDDGARILTSANFLPCTAEMRACESEFRTAVPIFVEQYPALVERARFGLNGLWRAEDYLSKEKLKKRFAFELKFYPLPDSKDFRAQIRDEDIEAIKKQIDFDTKATINKAMEEPYRRLFDGVAHMASRLSGAKTCVCRSCKGKTFKTAEFGDSLVDNLVEVCEILPRLNLTQDAGLDGLIEEVKASLCPFQPDAIRENTDLRNTLAARAAEIQNTFSSLFAAA